jgi:multidrug efflux pump subunit AcrA (membrane-fusion protein)
MNPKIRRIVLIATAVVVVIGGAAYFALRASAGDPSLKLSGTIEATEIQLASEAGGRVQSLSVQEGDTVQKWGRLASVYSEATQVNEVITSPIDGVVLNRLVEPDEFVAPGSPVLVVASMNDLSVTVFVPEDSYGQVHLGETVDVKVDSFPNKTFSAKVTHIGEQAEYTPRNVQTAEGRKTTVFAIKLALAPTGGKLKPGMPADVYFQITP